MAEDIPTKPLTPAVFHILLALSTRARHGYGIMKQVARDSENRVKMGPGTLYGSLNRMIEAGLICEARGQTDAADEDGRRIYYELTGQGRDALTAELARFRRIVAVAEQNGLAKGVA